MEMLDALPIDRLMAYSSETSLASNGMKDDMSRGNKIRKSLRNMIASKSKRKNAKVESPGTTPKRDRLSTGSGSSQTMYSIS